MENVIVFGLSDLAEVLIYHLEHDERYSIKAITVDKKYLQNCKLEGLFKGHYPIVPFEEIDDTYSPLEHSFFVCVGYNHMNEGRKLAFQRIKDKGYKIASFIHSTAIVQTDYIGEGNMIFENVTVGSFCSIGNGNIFYPCSHVAHHTKVGDFNFMAISCSIAGHVTIHDQCFFGNNSTTNNGIVVADKTLVGAGAYLSKDSKEGDVIVPMRSFTIDKKSVDIL